MSSPSIVQSRFSKIEQWCLIVSLILLACAVGLTAFMMHQYQDTFYPGVSIGTLPATGKTKQQIKLLLLDQENNTPLFSLTLHVDTVQVSSSSAELGGHYEYDKAIDEAFTVGRKEGFFSRLWRVVTPWPTLIKITPKYALDQERLKQQLSVLSRIIDQPAEEPSASLKLSQVATTLKLLPGKSGRNIDQDETIKKVLDRLAPSELHVPAVVASASAELSPDQITAATDRAKKFVSKKIIFRADNIFREMNDQLLISLLAFPTGTSAKKLEPVIANLSKEVNRPPQDAVFEYDKDTLKVHQFSPPRKGLGLNVDEFKTQLKKALTTLETTDTAELEILLPVQEANPAKSLAQTNDLGIAERIGFGESKYEHSIPNRIINVALTAQRVNDTIVKPGEEFSFNKALGDVSAATGFKQAYVIRNGRTELGDGGGVCQVSTTLFRALLNGGLPITKRRAHSYRVSYYELNSKPGVDATVYAGDVDLRFINDTRHAVLIHTQTDSQRLYMTVELYGTSDGRTAEIVDHKVWDFQPAPAPQYIDDPSLPRGNIKQVDFAASGVKASFKNVVKDLHGKVIREDEYFSNYVPWQAIFLRGV